MGFRIVLNDNCRFLRHSKRKYYNCNKAVYRIRGSAIITGSGWCDTSSYASQLTEDFGVTFTNDNDKTNQWSNSIKYHSITNGVNKLFFFRHAYLNVTSPSQVIVEVNGNPIMAVYDGAGTFIALPSESFELGVNFKSEIASSDNFVLWLNAIKWLISQSQAVSYALSFFWLDGFAVPAPAQVTQNRWLAVLQN